MSRFSSEVNPYYQTDITTVYYTFWGEYKWLLRNQKLEICFKTDVFFKTLVDDSLLTALKP